MPEIKIGDRTIGENSPTYFIADIAANHDGSIERAKELIHLAAEAGADAAKFQNFKAPKIVSDHGFKSLGGQFSHQKKWNKSVYEVYKDASIPDDWTQILYEECKKCGIDYSTSPYDIEAVDNAAPYVAFYKIGSGDITWPEIGLRMAEKGKPVFLATGASSMEDVDRMMAALLPATNSLALMQCNTNYTGSLENFNYINLRVLNEYARKWPGIVLGLSDHSPGHAAVLGAISLGARIIEKHFTDDTSRVGPDHAFSMTPKSWKEMVVAARELENALGDGVKKVEKNEMETVVLQRRSLRAKRDIAKGEKIGPEDLEALRPAPKDGFAPWQLASVIGQTLKEPLARGAHLTMRHLAGR